MKKAETISNNVAVSNEELKRLYRLIYEYEQIVRRYEKMLILKNQHQLQYLETETKLGETH